MTHNVSYVFSILVLSPFDRFTCPIPPGPTRRSLGFEIACSQHMEWGSRNQSRGSIHEASGRFRAQNICHNLSLDPGKPGRDRQRNAFYRLLQPSVGLEAFAVLPIKNELRPKCADTIWPCQWTWRFVGVEEGLPVFHLHSIF